MKIYGLFRRILGEGADLVELSISKEYLINLAKQIYSEDIEEYSIKDYECNDFWYIYIVDILDENGEVVSSFF